MTEPVPGALQPPGPAQAGFLTHFCARPTGTGQPAELALRIAGMSPWDRLSTILWERQLLGRPVYGAGHRPMTCFAEAPPDHLSWMITTRGFPPWALFVDRDWAHLQGAGPAWYVRPEEYLALAGTPLIDWAVRLDTRPGSRSDWLHEREWRHLGDSLPLRCRRILKSGPRGGL